MKNHIDHNPAFLAARETASRLQSELTRLNSEIVAHNAAAHLAANSQCGDAVLNAGIAILDGVVSVDLQLAELMRKRDTVSAAVVPALRDVQRVERAASSGYYQTQAAAVLAAMDGLVAALDSVVASGAAFESIRDNGARLGYDIHSTGLPIAAETLHIQYANDVLPELRRDADRLRDSLDTSLDTGTLYIRALIDLPEHNLMGGDTGAVPTRQARTLMLDNQAEPSDVRQKLRRLVA